MSKSLRVAASLFAISGSLLLAGCDCRGTAPTCPPGKSPTCDSFGKWQCWSITPPPPPPPTISGVGSYEKKVNDPQCFNDTIYSIYNNNPFSVHVEITAQPQPPNWPQNGITSVVVAANTNLEKSMEIGHTKYKQIDDCALINYKIISIKQ
jgi:hypothetical protein